MTETTAICILPDVDDLLVGSCGRPLANMEARLVDDEEKDVHPGDTGELWLRGPVSAIDLRDFRYGDLS